MVFFEIFVKILVVTLLSPMLIIMGVVEAYFNAIKGTRLPFDLGDN